MRTLLGVDAVQYTVVFARDIAIGGCSAQRRATSAGEGNGLLLSVELLRPRRPACMRPMSASISLRRAYTQAIAPYTVQRVSSGGGYGIFVTLQYTLYTGIFD
ncbi:hypothetical protein MRB53_037796 [Persea americana]|nr:hypothetical protein MRB53_037796 [Persea americana]